MRRLQIKDDPSFRTRGQRIGSIDIQKDFDAVLLVLLDHQFDAVEIYEAERDVVITAVMALGSRARNERGSLSVSKFKPFGRSRWKRAER